MTRTASSQPQTPEAGVAAPPLPTVIRSLPRIDPGPSRYRFPHPSHADEHGLVAYGGDFEPSTLLDAYRRGIFPWPHGNEDLLWFSPEPRCVLDPAAIHVPRRLERLLRQQRFRLTVNGAFRDVMAGCAERPEGTWITPRLAAGFRGLHELGWAHSIEVWDADGKLAGGLYGLSIGGVFAAESMFHRQTDGSSVALVTLARWAAAHGLRLIDAQMLTPHLARFGFAEIPREAYLARLEQALSAPVNFLGRD